MNPTTPKSLEEAIAAHNEQKITLPLKHFLELILGSREKVTRTQIAEELSKDLWNNLCDLLVKLDKEQHLIHVEVRPTDIAFEPTIWRIKDWKESNERLALMRARSEAERQKRFRRDAILDQLIKCVEIDTGLEREFAQAVALKIFKKPKQEAITFAKQFGLELIVSEEDGELEIKG